MAVYRLQELQYASEVAFASNATNPSTNTWDQRIPAENIILTIPHERIEDVASQNRLNAVGLSHIGAQTGQATLEFTTNLIGHMTDPAGGSLTTTWMYTLLGYAFGGTRSAGSGSAISGTTSTANTLILSDVSGWVAGDAIAVGTKGDGRGDGQVLVASGVTGGASGSIDLLTAAPAAPTTGGDTASRLLLVYPDETATLTTTRWMAMHSGTGNQFHMMGCQLAGVRFSWPLDGQGLAKATWTYRVALWDRVATTFPSSTSLQNNYGHVPGGGSFYIQNFATKTRATETPASLDLAINVGLEPTLGPGGNHQHQVVTAWVRTAMNARITWTIPWVTTYETWWETATQSLTLKHILFNSSPVGGYRTGFYCSRIFPVGDNPINPVNVNEQTYASITAQCTESTDTTSALTRSSWRLFMG